MYSQQIYTFVVVAEAGSFSKAAEKLYITTVSVMKQINALESRIGVKLFKRTNHGVVLTEAGETIYKTAKDIIRLSNETIKKVQKSASPKEYTIKVGTSMLYPAKPLVDLWGKIPLTDKPIKIKIIPLEDGQTNLLSIVNSLGKEIDCFVSPYESNQLMKSCNIYHLGEYDCCIAVSRNHKLANKKLIKYEDLYGESLMLVKKGQAPVMDKIRSEIEQNHPRIKIIDTATFYSAEVFNECEQKGYAMEILKPWADIHPSLVTIPVEWNFKVKYGIIYTKKPSKSVKEFIKAVSSVEI